MMCTDINNIIISNIHGVDYCWIIVGFSKSGAINLSKNTDLCKNRGSL